MRKRSINIFYIVIAILLFFSCKKNLATLDMANATLNPPSTNATIDWTGMDDNDKTTVFMDYLLSPINVGANPPLKYMIQVDTSATFNNPATLSVFYNITNDTNVSILVYTLDSTLKAKYNAEIGNSYTIYVRTMVNALSQNSVPVDSVVSSANSYYVGPIYGEALMFHYYDIPGGITPRIWWLVGNMTTNTWANGATSLGSGLWPLSVVDGLVYNGLGDGEFTGTFYFPNTGGTWGEFKIIRDPGTWNPFFGSSTNSIDNVTYEATGGNTNINIENEGWYKITLNSITNTCKVVATTAPTTASYTDIGMVGTINSWAAPDIAMTAIQTSNNHIWYTTYTFGTSLPDGNKVKFRQGSNWNGSDWGGGYFPFSLGGGNDITVSEGTYTVIVNDIDKCNYFIKQ